MSATRAETQRFAKWHAFRLSFAVPVFILASTCFQPAHATEAFDALRGGWSGGGRVSFQSGEAEKLKCSARYSGGGSNLNLNVKCASASAQISLSSNLSAHGGKVSGEWNESSYGLSGGAYGSTSGGSVRLKISGSASGYLTLTVSGSHHTIALSTQGTPVTGVNVSLNRR